MATVGTLGNIVFSVSSNRVNTFDGLSWDSAAQYATHNRHLQEPLIEFVGVDSDKISLSMYFSVFLGVDPVREINRLLHAERSGQVMRLIIGGRAYGRHRWVIEKSRRDFEHFDGRGRLIVARYNISLLAYARR